MATRFAVQHVPLEARRFITVLPTDSIWAPRDGQTLVIVRGAIVRLQPPADASDERVQQVAELYRQAGSHVRVMPRQRAGQVVMPERVKRPSRTVRQVVLEMTQHANTHDRAALSELVTRTLDEEQL